MTLSAAAVLPASAAARLGDVDNDGEITSGDARLALRAAVSLETITPDFLLSADVDRNGEIEASDARMILRASVQLEDLSRYDHTHQVETWTPIKDDPAGAEYHSGVCTICGQTVREKHNVVSKIIKESTCTEPGEAEERCGVCGQVLDIATVPAGHTWKTVEGTEKPATCTQDGSREVVCEICGVKETQVIPAAHTPGAAATCTAPQVCSVCGETIAPALGHTYEKNAAVTATKGVRCERCGEIGLPGFNDLVNGLKDGTHTFSGVVLCNSTSEKPKLEGIMEPLIKGFETMAKSEAKKNGQTDVEDLDIMSMLNNLNFSETENKFISKSRINKKSFYLFEQDVVSALKDSDAVSMTTELIDGVDFLRSLPDSFTPGSSSEQTDPAKTIDLTKLKNTEIGQVRKITVTFAPEQYSKIAAEGGDSPISRINNLLTEMSTMGGYDLKDLLGDTEELKSLPLVGALFSASEFILDSFYSTVVTYYFDAVTNAPIAAYYDDAIKIQFKVDTYLDDVTMERTSKKTGSFEMNFNNDMDYYYFFDDNFNS